MMKRVDNVDGRGEERATFDEFFLFTFFILSPFHVSVCPPKYSHRLFVTFHLHHLPLTQKEFFCVRWRSLSWRPNYNNFFERLLKRNLFFPSWKESEKVQVSPCRWRERETRWSYIIIIILKGTPKKKKLGGKRRREEPNEASLFSEREEKRFLRVSKKVILNYTLSLHSFPFSSLHFFHRPLVDLPCVFSVLVVCINTVSQPIRWRFWKTSKLEGRKIFLQEWTRVREMRFKFHTLSIHIFCLPSHLPSHHEQHQHLMMIEMVI